MAKEKVNNMNTNKKEFLDAFRRNAGNISDACKTIGIGRTTYYLWMKNDKDFKAEVEAVEESLIDYAESMLMKQIREGNMTGIIFFLKTKGKERGYVERTEQIVDVGSIPVLSLDPFSDDTGNDSNEEDSEA